MGGRITGMTRYLPHIYTVKVLSFAVFWLLVLGIFLIDQNGVTYFCGQNYDCRDGLTGILNVVLSMMLPVAGIMTILFLLQDAIFAVWIYLFLTWAPLYLWFVFSTSSANNGYIAPNNRAIASLEGIIFFVVASLIIIVLRSIQLHKKKK